MDVIYEESAVNAKNTRGEKIYKVLNIFSKIFGFVALVSLIFFLFMLLSILVGGAPGADADQNLKDSYILTQSGTYILGIFTLFFGGLWLWIRMFKRRVNVSYDYTFVSGELRIAKVFNVNRRKFLYRVESEDILQLGDVECDSYDRIKADPSNKTIVCTSNSAPAEGKFFMYIHCVAASGRTLYVLECRETLLVHMLKFVKRGTLAPDYVSQEKKNK